MTISGSKGFSLIELLVAIVLVTIMAGFASFGNDLIRRERVAAAARELYADLQKARMDAMTQAGKGFGIRFESNNSYVLFKFDDCDDDYAYDNDTCSGGAEEALIVKKTLGPDIVLAKTNLSTPVSNDVRIFDRFGSPRQASWGMGNLTILLKNAQDAGLIKCISVSTNRIREAVWTGSECSEQ